MKPERWWENNDRDGVNFLDLVVVVVAMIVVMTVALLT